MELDKSLLFRSTEHTQSLKEKIVALKKEKNAVILAHYYQEHEIQDIADFIGDSLALSQKAATTDAEIILFAGVYFMGETAKILCPEKKVLVPELEASCSLADSCPPLPFAAFKAKYPEHLVVTYINCSAEIKALSDIVCTSSNAKKIIDSLPIDQPIIFAPDRNLGEFLKKVTGRDLVLWDGTCLVHEAFALDKIIELHKNHPSAKFIAHPESAPEILNIASYVGSTAGMIEFAKTDLASEYIVGTEAGILYQMQKAVPEKLLIAAPSKEDNTCACSECHFMKMNTLEKVYYSLQQESPEVLLDEKIRRRALVPIQRMMDCS